MFSIHNFILLSYNIFFRLKSALKLKKNKPNASLIKAVNLIEINEENKPWELFYKSFKTDFITFDTNNFCNFPSVRLTMFFNNDFVVSREIRYLSHKYDKNFLQKTLGENKVGSPKIHKKYFNSSHNLIHHFYHLSLFEDYFGSLLCENYIEFGSGYGSMCRLITRLYKDSNYYLIDHPILLAISNFFLNQVSKEDNRIINNKNYTDEMNISNYFFISTWALSETNYNTREKFKYLILNSDKFLIAIYKRWETFDNLDYFKKIQKKLVNHESRILPIENMKDHYYFIGCKKNIII